ncbi:hypothetical protein BDV97DRAFT_124000 [Delphinella strobiligena]|nr:hypothetical protein BDV97DRAFT_124000 [Delphinella strobiligena]
MAMPVSIMSLHGAPDGREGHDGGDSVQIQKRAAIVVNLNEQVMRDLQQCCQNGKVLQLVGGKSARIRYGSKTLDLNVRPETFRHEIYSAGKEGSSGHGAFTALVSHEAQVKAADKKTEADCAGADAALATLKQSLASMAKDKEARKATINNQVVSTSKNGRLNPHRQPSLLVKRKPTASSATSTPQPSAAPTSTPQVNSQVKGHERGMRTVLVHLLAIKPLSEQDIISHTHIPNSHLSSLLPKIADKSASNTWELNTKSFKDLDPWTFNYQSEVKRQTVIDNAIRAFDRARLDKDDKHWQLLLPREKRGKGKVLSRLHLSVERRDQLATPALAATPLHTMTETAENMAATPKTGLSSTPRNGTLPTGRSGAGISIEKRLKEAKKKQEKQDLEKKKKEREALAGDRETKARETKPRPTTAKRVPAKKIPEKVKSDEVVHDSDDEDGEITDAKPTKTTSKLNMTKHLAAAETRANAPGSKPSSLAPDDVAGLRPTKREKASESTHLPKKAALSASVAPANKSKSTTTLKQPPSQRPIKTSESTPSSRQRQVSPKKDTKPKVPSPLGTSKPRNASEEADKIPNKNSLPPKSTAISAATKTSQPANANRASLTPKLGFYGSDPTRPNGPVIKKRPLDHASPPRKPAKIMANSTTKAKVSVDEKAASSNIPSSRANVESKVKSQTKPSLPAVKPAMSPKNSDGKLKRKANAISSGAHDHDVPASKHRKTDSSSTHSLDPTNSSLTSLTTAPTASPDPTSPRSNIQRTPPSGNPMDVIQMFLNDAEASPKTKSDWESALDKAAKFRMHLYPAYIELYDRLESMSPEEVSEEDRRTLFMMHSKLKAFKKNIYDAVG